ncbi:MAG TPA: M17 family peptidase N-terminal domain-containing protein, partial [Blastocatellia bacterium]|nr:M17 family peptidase N-terminal domain-containing protein [Blastocatellia bacterium]
MKVISSGKTLSEIASDVLIVPVFEGETPREGALAALDHLTGGAVAEVFDQGEFEGKHDRWVLLRNVGTLAARRLLLYGGGEVDSVSPLVVQRIAGAAIRTLGDRGIRSAAFLLTQKIAASPQSVVEGAMLGQMSCDLYKSDERSRSQVEEFVLVGESGGTAELERAVEVGACMAEAANFARRLGFEPSNVMTPQELARQAQEMA